jgi:hypothetical protein
MSYDWMTPALRLRDEEIIRLTAEVERLKAEATDAAIALAALNSGEDLQRVMRENERLRAALEEVRVLVFCANHSETRYPKARAALTQEPAHD